MSSKDFLYEESQLQIQEGELQPISNLRNSQPDNANYLYDSKVSQTISDCSKISCTSTEVSSYSRKTINSSNLDQLNEQIQNDTEDFFEEFVKQSLKNVDETKDMLQQVNIQSKFDKYLAQLENVYKILRQKKLQENRVFEILITTSNNNFFHENTKQFLQNSQKQKSNKNIEQYNHFCLCGKFFMQESSLKNHFQAKHKDKKIHNNLIKIYKPFGRYTGCKSSPDQYFSCFKEQIEKCLNSNLIKKCYQTSDNNKMDGLQLVEYLLSVIINEEFKQDFQQLENELQQIKQEQNSELNVEGQKKNQKRHLKLLESAEIREKLEKKIEVEEPSQPQKSCQMGNRQSQSDNKSNQILNQAHVTFLVNSVKDNSNVNTQISEQNEIGTQSLLKNSQQCSENMVQNDQCIDHQYQHFQTFDSQSSQSLCLNKFDGQGVQHIDSFQIQNGYQTPIEYANTHNFQNDNTQPQQNYQTNEEFKDYTENYGDDEYSQINLS
ncbi:hypothetical protein ABPG73_017136 [Tetrahymena malaccensis]